MLLLLWRAAAISSRPLHWEWADRSELDSRVRRPPWERPEPEPELRRSLPAMVEETPTAVGVPDEGWTNCAEIDQECACRKGDVRIGTAHQGVWTQPVKLGDKEEVMCDLASLGAVRVSIKDLAGTRAARQCQCIDRQVKISTSVGVASSFSERGSTGPAGLYAADGPFDVCLTVPWGSEITGSLVQSPMDELLAMEKTALAVAVLPEPCSESDGQVWTYLMSSGQIRNDRSGKCIAAIFNTAGEAKLGADACRLDESKLQSQRWFAEFYVTPFTAKATGKIKLGHGAHSEKPLCLAADTDDARIVECDSPGSSSVEWTFEVPGGGSHVWNSCAEEEAICECTGEMRMGDGEADVWSAGVPMHNEGNNVASVQCDLHLLQTIAVPDPVAVPDMTNPNFRECQCRNAQAEEVVADTVVEGISLKAVDSGAAATESGSTGLIIGGVAGGLVVILGVVVMMRKGGDEDGADIWAEFGEGEEEEYEEGEEWEEGT